MVRYSVFIINPKEYNIRAAIKSLLCNEVDFILLKDLEGLVPEVPKLEIEDKVYLYLLEEGICARATVIGKMINIGIEEQYKETARKFWKNASFEATCNQCENRFIPVRVDRIAPNMDGRIQYYTDAFLTYLNASENEVHYSISEELAAQIDFSLEDVDYEEVTEEEWNTYLE